MAENRTKRATKSTPREATDEAAPGGGEESDLLERASSWARVARDAYRRCTKGSDAVEELLRRRNRSGE